MVQLNWVSLQQVLQQTSNRDTGTVGHKPARVSLSIFDHLLQFFYLNPGVSILMCFIETGQNKERLTEAVFRLNHPSSHYLNCFCLQGSQR